MAAVEKGHSIWIYLKVTGNKIGMKEQGNVGTALKI
jgi:hypothetical protein